MYFNLYIYDNQVIYCSTKYWARGADYLLIYG